MAGSTRIGRRRNRVRHGRDAGFWLTPLLLWVPVFSRDTYSYLAQGALLRDGLDPYAVGPIDNPNPLLDNVSPIWTITTAPYGPAFIMVAKFVTMLVGNHVIVGTMLLRLCMLPGLAMLIWAAPRIARHVGANVPIALWICVLNPLVIIHLMGGVHNEMLMVGLMAAGIALTFQRRPVAGIAVIAVGMAVKATAGLALPFMVWVWMRQLRDRREYRPLRAFLVAAAAIGADLRRGVRRALLGGRRRTRLADRAGRLGEDHQLAESSDRGRESGPRRRRLVLLGQFLQTLQITRAIGIAIIAMALPLLWWRFRHDDREALTGIAWVMLVVVLFAPAALPWYYSWPLAVVAPLAQSRRAVASIAAFSTWIMVIFKPDGAHGMYSWPHVLLATAVALFVWRVLNRPAHPGHPATQCNRPEVSTPWPAPGAALRAPDARATRRPGGHCSARRESRPASPSATGRG